MERIECRFEIPKRVVGSLGVLSEKLGEFIRREVGVVLFKEGKLTFRQA